MNKVFLYAEYQTSVPFDQFDWPPTIAEMRKHAGLKSKTWLSGVNNHTIGGFYEFDSLDNAQSYIDNCLLPYAKEFQANLSVKLFNGDVTEAASVAMDSPFYPQQT